MLYITTTLQHKITNYSSHNHTSYKIDDGGLSRSSGGLGREVRTQEFLDPQ